MSSRPVYRMCAQVAPSGECLLGKGPPDRMLAKPWRRLKLVIAAVLRDSLCCVIAVLRGRLLYVVYHV